MNPAQSNPPLAGILVLDLSRMLPGAVLARQLIDLGARVIKVEDPAGGDPMRAVPPQVDGIGIGFATFYRGAESIVLDLRKAADAATLVRIVARADIFVESFRPGTLEGWGLGAETLQAANPQLILCSLSSFGTAPEVRDRVAHDLNLCAVAGLLDLLDGRVPRIQIADVTAGLLASSAVIAALFARERTGRGEHIDQPLAAGVTPFLTWNWAERAIGDGAVIETLLGGGCPCYRIYTCGDGKRLSVAALEPKFWSSFVEMIERPELETAAFAVTAASEQASAAVQEALKAHPREHWLRLALQRGLPVGPVHTPDEARAEPVLAAAGLCEATPLPGGGSAAGVGPYVPTLGSTPDFSAPRFGEHTASILAEYGLEDPD